MPKYLHTMIRVTDINKTVAFFELLGLKEVRRFDHEKGRFTLVFMAAPGDEDAQVELTYNWPAEDGTASEVYTGGRNFGHLAYRVENIYETCQRRHDQSPPARRPHGLHPHARQYLGRTPAGWPSRSGRALGVHAQYGRVVIALSQGEAHVVQS
jgi:lactoylglutathione lyase